MNVELLYGRDGLSIDLPDDLDVTLIRKRLMPVLSDPSGTLRQALRNPVRSPTLIEAARGARSACILICDVTRPVPNEIILGPVIRELLAAGVDRSRITVLIATGLHRSVQGSELAELVADPWVLETVPVVNHSAQDDTLHVDLGTTSRGTRVRLDERFVQSDVRVVTGLVEPHFMAGYSGGRKVIAPGVAHRDTITTLHNAAFMEHSRARNCIVEGNPLHEELLEIVRMVGGALAINAVIDEHRRVSFLNFGEVEASHLAAVDFVRPFAEIPVSRRFATVVTTAAGHPLDATYYQTIKGMVSPLGILEEGGDVIIASRCAEGFGSREFRAAQASLVNSGSEAFLQKISMQDHARIDEWETEMQVRAMRKGSIYLYTDGLDEAELQLTGVESADSVEDAVRRSVENSSDPSIAVVPEGPYVVPFCDHE